MAKYMDLLQSTNYVTRRQSLKLLGELLLDRANFTIMTRYIGDPENLKLMMNMLRDKSKNIQFEVRSWSFLARIGLPHLPTPPPSHAPDASAVYAVWLLFSSRRQFFVLR